MGSTTGVAGETAQPPKGEMRNAESIASPPDTEKPPTGRLSFARRQAARGGRLIQPSSARALVSASSLLPTTSSG